MQNLSLLQLKIPVSHMSAAHFKILSTQAQGDVIEEDMDGGITSYVAWFSVSAVNSFARLKTDLEIQAALLGIAPEHIHIQALRDDWETAWQEAWHAQAIGQNLCVRPSFCDPLPNKVDLILEPGLAFGTGQHQTTRLCLCAIEKLLNQQKVHSMLDMGAGSGLLAIAAAKLGVSDITAIDMEEDSVTACIENAKINAIQLVAIKDHVPPQRQFGLVVANILANPLIDMAPLLSTCVEKHLILSGLLQTQVDALVSAYQAHGLRLQEISHEDEWVAILFTK